MDDPTLKRGFHIGHLNCHSLCNKFVLFERSLSQSNFDIFCMSETWLHPRLPDEFFKIEHYNLIRQDRAALKRGGGLGIYIKDNINYSVSELRDCNINNNTIELTWISVKNDKYKNLSVGVVYRPPQSNVAEFCETLTNITNRVMQGSNAEIFILGDFNIDYNKKIITK